MTTTTTKCLFLLAVLLAAASCADEIRVPGGESWNSPFRYRSISFGTPSRSGPPDAMGTSVTGERFDGIRLNLNRDLVRLAAGLGFNDVTIQTERFTVAKLKALRQWADATGNFKFIKDQGMTLSVWVHEFCELPADIGKEHPDWFVKKADGSLFTEHGFYVLDTKNPEAIDGMVRPIYRGLKQQGWDYVKIDGAGDLLNAYKNQNCADHFKRIGSTPEESLRDWDRVAREELGPDVYILSCWGVGPGRNVMGLVDACRLSDDGFQPETLANFSSWEGVVWRNDPDHCDVLGSWLMDEQASMPVFGLDQPAPVRTIVRPAICSLAGSVLMVSDKVEVYHDDVNIEGMKRSAPVLPTVPGQLYDAGQRNATWWLQEIERPFERWAVLSRIQWAKKRETEWKFDLKGLPPQEVKFGDLGLDPEREYVVFEFWTQKFLGKFKGSFTAPAMDASNGMDIFAIREARPHPWVISTSRHISQGGVSLLDEKWDQRSNILSGQSAVVAGDPYVLTVHVPDGFKLKESEVMGEAVESRSQKETATIRIVPSATKPVKWKLTFSK